MSEQKPTAEFQKGLAELLKKAADDPGPETQMPQESPAERESLSIEATPEQMRYAQLLEKGMLLGLAMLFVTFLLYLTGLLESYVPPHKLSEYWKSDVVTFLSKTGLQDGWSWVRLLGYGDILNFIGIAFLAGVTVLCYLAIVPILWRSKDRIYVVLALLEVVILSVAASGVLGVGGH